MMRGGERRLGQVHLQRGEGLADGSALDEEKPRPARLILFTHTFMPSVGPCETPLRR